MSLTVVKPLSRQAILSGLQRNLAQAGRRARRERRPVLASHSFRTPTPDPIDLFDANLVGTGDRFLWTAPGGSLSISGLGAAWSVSSHNVGRLSQAATLWRRLLRSAIVDAPIQARAVGPVLVGGMAFDRFSSGSPLWEGYPTHRLVLPRLLFTDDGEDTWLTINTIIEPDHDLQAEAENAVRECSLLLDGPPKDRTCSGIDAGQIVIEDDPPVEEWQSVVRSAVDCIRSGGLTKVVLARHVQVTAERPFDVATVLRRLRADYPSCYLFAVGGKDRCFLGATPERLIRLEKRRVEVACLAGTTGRGSSPQKDEALGRALLNSVKDRTEHDVVVNMIKKALVSTCSSVTIPGEPCLVKFNNLQHLYTPVTGFVPAEQTVLDVVERLHPTPAVGGYPREEAVQFIREHENWDRGWYAGPVGWLDRHGEGEFCVAIRSGLLTGDQADLFAGCGIVADSDPDREYDESCLKLQPLLAALGGHND